MSIFSAILEDNSLYMGGDDYSDCKWKEIDKPIKILFYYLNNGECIKLEGYERYCHYVEACVDINGINAGKTRLVAAYLLAQKDNKVYIKKINDTVQEIVIDASDKQITQLNPIGWKKGGL
jgi:hypothetical protein